MKCAIRERVRLGLFLAAIGLLAAVVPVRAGDPVMSVHIRRADLRQSPSFLARVTASVEYGETVTVRERRDEWMRVTTDSEQTAGWLHQSALTRSRIELRATESAPASVTTDEVALAGKGFSPEVEAEFKTRHQDVSFEWVDRMEKMTVPVADVSRFLEEGQVAPAAKEADR